MIDCLESGRIIPRLHRANRCSSQCKSAGGPGHHNFRQDDLVNVSKFICGCISVILVLTLTKQESDI